MSAALIPDRITPVSQDLFAQTYGGSLICCMVMLLFYGASVLQTYMYFLNYDGDNLEIKAMVTAVMALGTTHAIFVCRTVYHYLVLSYTRPLSIIDGEWSVYAATAVGVVICFLVQIFFARAIYHLTRRAWRVVTVVVFSILITAQIAFGILLSVKLFQLWQLTRLREAVYVAMVPLFTIRVVSDAVTAGMLCYLLYDSRQNFGRSIKLVKMLIIYSINRFVLTTVVVIAQTIILLARPETIWAMVIEFVSVHLYVNSFLATLNARNHLRAGGKQKDATSSTVRGIQVSTTAVTDISADHGMRAFDTKPYYGARSQSVELNEFEERKNGSRVGALDV